MESLPNRPPPARPLGEAVRAWVAWFGVVRLIVIAVSVVGVGAGAYWLLRAPATPVENTLPYARSSSATTSATTTTTASVEAGGSRPTATAQSSSGSVLGQQM